MNTQDAIRNRRSARSYRPEQITEDALNTILSAIYAAPVAGGKYKAMEVTVIQNVDVLREISDTLQEAMHFPANPLYGAPTMLIISGNDLLDNQALYANTGVMLENAQISATDFGLGSCIIWGAGFAMAENAELMKKLSFSNGYRPLAGLVIGQMDKVPPQRKEKEAYKTNWIR